jgi:carbamoyl-phosphate synthase large subunit
VFYQKPCIETDPSYLPWLQELIEQENVRLVLPGIEEDVFFFHENRSAMSKWPVDVVLNSSAALAAGHDKWHMHQILIGHGLPAIPTTTIGTWSEMLACLGDPPFIAKARRGSGSRGQRIIYSEEEWSGFQHLFSTDHMMQKLVGTDEEEYTLGLYGYGDGTSSPSFVTKRRLWNGGTWQAEVVKADANLETLCQALTNILRPIGPTNYQFRREAGQWLLLEVNPRISASTAIRAGFGFNEAKLCADHYLHGVSRPVPAALRSGRCQRYVTEHFDFL